MVFMPPGSAKSSYGSMIFPAWYIGRNPKDSIIASSHTTELAERFGRRVRNTIADPAYRQLFDVQLAGDSQAAGRWATQQGGEYYAAGAGSAIVGFRADMGVIDDPIAGREQADSEREREKVWSWYKSDFYTRLKPGAAVVLIMQRWHEDDLAGRLLKEGESGGEQWHVLRLPMEAEQDDPLGRKPGEPLWPEWYTDEMRTQAKRDPRVWSALYQQRPAPDTGLYFHRDWFRWYDTKPEHLRIYGASDYALTEGGGDWTVHMVVGVDPSDRIFLLDYYRAQVNSMDAVMAWLSLVQRWKPLRWAEEKGQIARSIGPFIDKMQRDTRTYCYREAYSVTGDKAMRAQAFRARAAQGYVYLPAREEWAHDMISRLLQFPVSPVDDEVDVVGLIGRMLDVLRAAEAPPPPKPKPTSDLTFDQMIRATSDEKPKSRYRR